MDIYKGQQCSVCNLYFNEQSDIVCCPTCGAPHHRECYAAVGKCFYDELHGTPNQWVRKDKMSAEVISQTLPTVTKVCVHCHQPYESDKKECPSCGVNFDKPAVSQNQDQQNQNAQGALNIPYMMSLKDPLGGISPETTIDGIPVTDVATFVTNKSKWYIPRFIKMGTKKRSWNWASFLFSGFWLMYRKCYKEGFIVLLCMTIANTLVLPARAVLLNIEAMAPQDATNAEISALVSSNMHLFTANIIILFAFSLLLNLLIKVFCGIFGNHLYKKHCINKIINVKKKFAGQDYHIFLLTRGGVALLSIPFFLMVYLIVSNTISSLIIY